MSTPYTFTVQIPDPIKGDKGDPGIDGVSPVLDMNALAAAVAKILAPVAPPVTPPPPPPPVGSAPVLKVVIAQNGKTPWTQDYSYGNAVITHDFPGGNGNANCIKCVVGVWGGFQPSNNNGQATDFSMCDTITVDVSGPKGSQYSVQFLRFGDLPIVGPTGNHFTKTKDGWETFTFPALLLMTDKVLGDVRKLIYKGAVESQNNQPSTTYYVDNWGGV